MFSALPLPTHAWASLLLGSFCLCGQGQAQTAASDIIAYATEALASVSIVSTDDSGDTQDLDRIARERERIQQNHALQRRSCYQRFAVSSCLLQAEDDQRVGLASLREQELRIQERQRYLRAKERLVTIAARQQQMQARQAADQMRLQQAQSERDRKLKESAERLQIAAQDEQARSTATQRNNMQAGQELQKYKQGRQAQQSLPSKKALTKVPAVNGEQ